MKKSDFLIKLKKSLQGLPKKEVQDHISFYSEMIDDRIEEGLTEEAAVGAIGDVRQISEQILNDLKDTEPPSRADNKKEKLKGWEIALLIIGSPIWLSILITVFAVAWSLVLTLWAIELPFLALEYVSKHLITVCKAVSLWCGKLTKKTVMAFRFKN